MSKNTKTLRDSDIKTTPTRRRALGLLGLGVAATGAMSLQGQHAHAQGADADDGAWTDAGSCPRGVGGEYTGLTDQDGGAVTDVGGYGRGQPYC